MLGAGESLVTHAVTCCTLSRGALTARFDPPASGRPPRRSAASEDRPGRRRGGTPRRGSRSGAGSGRRVDCSICQRHVSESQAACRRARLRPPHGPSRTAAPPHPGRSAQRLRLETDVPAARRSSRGPGRPPSRPGTSANRSIAGCADAVGDFSWQAGWYGSALVASVRRRCRASRRSWRSLRSSQISQVASATARASASSRSSISRYSALRAWVQDVDVPTIFTPARAYAASVARFVAALSGGRRS